MQLLRNVSQACRMMDVSRDMSHPVKKRFPIAR